MCMTSSELLHAKISTHVADINAVQWLFICHFYRHGPAFGNSIPIVHEYAYMPLINADADLRSNFGRLLYLHRYVEYASSECSSESAHMHMRICADSLEHS